MSARLAGGLLMTLSAAALADGGTVAGMTQHHDSRWLSRLVVRTPSILPPAPQSKLPPDLDEALAHYDQVIALSTEPATRVEAMRRGAYLRVRSAEADPSSQTAQAALHRAIELYRAVLAEAPNDAGNDRAHYQLARAHELLGETAEASAQLTTLARDFPDSPLAGDAHFRAGELLYLTRQYAAAEIEYRAIVESSDTAPYHRFAVYKYGWSLYHQGKLDEALAPFLTLIATEPAGSEMATDALRVTGLAFAALGDDAIAKYFAKHGQEPSDPAALYLAAGTQQEQMQRYSDAASTFAAYVSHHPDAARAPEFESRAVGAYEHGGFADEVLKAKSDYVARFGPGSTRWPAASTELGNTLRGYLDDVAQALHAKAQQAPAGEERTRLFASAADAYRRRLQGFPSDAKTPDINLLYADALLESGDPAQAAQQYLHTAYELPSHPRRSEAAFAAVQTLQAIADRSDAATRPSPLHDAITAGIRLADAFPQHAQWADVMSASASDEVALGDWDAAITLAQRVLGSRPAASPATRSRMLGIVADGHFAASRYVEAEHAYAALLAGSSTSDPQRQPVTERLAASIYKQAEAARTSGDLRAAADGFRRVARATPTASICATADYDAAAALMALQDWRAARAQLETFRTRYPDHALSVEVDKKLAVADQNDHLPSKAAEAYARIARAKSEPLDARANASLLSARLYDEAGATAQAASAYRSHLADFAVAPELRAELTQRLADIADEAGDAVAYRGYLDQIIAIDAAGGTDRTRTLAARATLEIGRMQAASARSVALSQPLAKTLSRRKSATDAAIATLIKAADYRLADVTPAASYEVGRLYTDFASALVHSERPRSLKGEALEQYQLLLEEQSDPFEQKAIAAHEANLARLRDNVWNAAIQGSADQLSSLVPGRYGKREINEASDDSLR
ncbi:MAG TPA: tetratricopeptide repeat protein [Nevskiaceae bacterium]|nr:tetratricopeptide repeat protein [Nevskiaceae bacterium]